MSKFNTVGEIKEAAQMLDTAVVQWLNASPPEYVQNKLNEARALLQRGIELADAPLRIAIVGEFNSGKTLLLNSLLDTTDLFPCLLQPTTGNVLEVKVCLREEEKPPAIKGATASFFNQFEIENVLDYYLRDLKNQGIEGLPSKVGMNEIEKLEKFLCKKFVDLKSITPKYAIISALEFLLALRYNQELVYREERQIFSLPMDLIPTALTLTARPDLNKGIQAIYTSMREVYDRHKDGKIDKLTSANLRAVFPVIRRVMVEVSAWAAPFGVSDLKACNSLAFLDFPGLGAESSSARDYYLCMTEIKDAHSVLVMFNGSNPGTAGASVMATLFQRAGKLTSDRTIVAVNRFDEFHPLPTDRTVETYYQNHEQGTTVGFCNILIPAKNLLSGLKKINLYICSALCYLFDEKARRPNWNFGSPQWFNDSKRQAAYTCYKRCQDDFKRIIHEVSKTGVKDHEIMRMGLQRYLEGGGVSALRSDLVQFAMDKGEKLIKEDSLKEIRAAYALLDEIAPALRANGEAGPINPEVSFAAQEFYRVLELAVADTLPGGPSEYKKLKIHAQDKDISLWETIEEETASKIMSWPEWFAILNQGITKGGSPRAADKPQKRFARYQNLKKQGCEVPTEFKAFDERFRTTAQGLTQQTLEGVGKAMLYSLQRFEQHNDYRDAIGHFQTMIMAEQLGSIEEALPLLDVWQPSKMAEEEIIPTVLERISDEVSAIENLSYPYDGSKPCFWNLALIVRIQVQLLKTYRDRLSRLVAAAESEFESFFSNEVLRAEILPLVRSALNNPDFLGKVAVAESGRSWESVGQIVRAAVENAKAQDGVPGATKVSMAALTEAHEGEPGAYEEEEDVTFEAQTPATPAMPKEQSKFGKQESAPKQASAKPETALKPAGAKPETTASKPSVAKLDNIATKPGAKPESSMGVKAVPSKGLQDKDVPQPAPEYTPEIVNDEEGESEDKEFEEW